MTIQNEIIWAEFLGNGFVAGPFDLPTIDTVTSQGDDVYDIVLSWTDIYSDTDRMIDNVGARVYIEGFSSRNVPDGYYTITAGTTSDVTISGIFASTPTTGAPTTTASITIEDFYKISNGIPDFVSGTSAASRWLNIISEEGLSSTIGQRISPRGGVSSFDGFSLSANFVDDTVLSSAGVTADTTQRINAFKRLARSQAALAMDASSLPIALGSSAAYTDTTIVKRGTSDLLASFKSSDASFNFIPAVIDREALLLISTSAGTGDTLDILCRRGILGTGNGSTGTFHTNSSVIYSGLQTGNASLCRIRSLPIDATTYNFKFVAGENSIVDDGLIYSGVVENIKFADNLSRISFELSPQIFGAGRSSFGAKVATRGKLTSERIDATQYDFVFDALSPRPTMSWKWVKLNDDIAVKLRPVRDRTSYDPDADPTLSSEAAPGQPGVFRTKTIVDSIVWDPASPNNNDNYVILSLSKDVDTWAKKSRTMARIIGGEDIATEARERETYCIQDLDDGLYGRDGVRNTEVRTLDITRFLDATPETCHVFETSGAVFPSSPDEDGLRDCYVAKITIPELLLQILLSDAGDGGNGPFDVLPMGLGLAISQDDIDYDSFGYNSDTSAIDWDLSPGVLNSKLLQALRNVIILSKDSDNINKWLDKTILKPFNLGLVQTSKGKVRLIDTTHLNEAAVTKTLGNIDLNFDHDSNDFRFRQSYDASNLYQNVTVEIEDPSRRWTFQKATVITTAVESIADADGGAASYANLYTYIQASPLKFKMPYAPEGRYTSTNVMQDFVGKFVQIYSKILPTIEFTALSNKYDIGDKPSIDLDNVISPLGSRGFTGYAIIIDKKTNIFARQSQYKAYIIADQLLEAFGSRVWAASAKVSAGSTTTVINVEENEFVPTDGTDIGSWTNDSDAFEVDDSVLLYDENFVLLSVDGSGNDQPRTVTAVTSTTIEINSPFTDGSAVNITPAADYIVMHADKGIQANTTTQDNLAWINDNETKW
jgi:hypothetical protein